MTAKKINELFRKAGYTLGSIESFTGGLFAKEVTAIPGASHFYKGGLVTYATEEKNRLLNISYQIIDQYGVVSKEVAYEMAKQGKRVLNVDYCISFTGNAGPSAMENKKVGEVYIGLATPRVIKVIALQLIGSREDIQREGVNQGLLLLEKEISAN